jgi:hypothetical protein
MSIGSFMPLLLSVLAAALRPPSGSGRRCCPASSLWVSGGRAPPSATSPQARKRINSKDDALNVRPASFKDAFQATRVVDSALGEAQLKRRHALRGGDLDQEMRAEVDLHGFSASG